jgi:phosphotransferase system enzyme I (PtsI)
MITRKGISASPGVAIGPALFLDAEEYRIPRRTIDSSQVPGQINLLDAALDASRQEVAELRVAAARKLGEQTAEIFAFHEAFIADAGLRQAIASLIESQHFTAAYALSQEMAKRQRPFRGVADPYLALRVRDLYDIERRILRHILGREREDITKLTEPVVVVAHDITPAQAVSFDPRQVLGIAVNVGGQTSHMAIIARMLDIPAVVALNDITSDIGGGETLIVDGTHGLVIANPDASTIERYEAMRREYQDSIQQLAKLRDLPSVTQDGVPITLMANIELASEAKTAIELGAEGVGLYRTEFLFLSRERPPTEEQQYEAFRTAVRDLDGLPIVIRTLDLGADKLTPASGAPHDQNPDLGLRSIRFCLQHLDMYKTHLRAILRASAEGDVRIMFPMITTLLELRQARSTLADVMEDLEEDGIPFRRDMPVGIMVETPAVALQAAAFAREVAFMSIGTNDLTQYTLAVDRSNERVAYLYAPHSPAVLKLIRETIQAARRAEIGVTLCGEMAGEAIYTELLIGAGLRCLSMAPQDIPEIKRIVRMTTIKRCEAIFKRVQRCDADRQIWNLLRDNLNELIPETV